MSGPAAHGALRQGSNGCFLSARNPDRLKRFASEFLPSGEPSHGRYGLEAAQRDGGRRDLRSQHARPGTAFCDALPPGSIVCDAGYPKNLSPDFVPREGAIFYGGLGQASGGIQLDPDLLGVIYPYSLSNVAHGCLLEGIALAMEKRFEPFSQGRGLITPAARRRNLANRPEARNRASSFV